MSLIPRAFAPANFQNYYSPTAAVDVVGVYDSSFNQLFEMARPSKANVNPQAKTADHPVESGSEISDNKVILPVEIELYVFVTDYRNTYQKINAAFIGQDLLTVQTRTGTYENMTITGIPHEETPEMFNVVTMAISLKQITLIDATFQALPPAQVKKPRDSSTVDRGQQSGKQDSGSVGSVGYGGIFG